MQTSAQEDTALEYRLPEAIVLPNAGLGGTSRRAAVTARIVGREVAGALVGKAMSFTPSRRRDRTGNEPESHATAAAVRRAFARLGATYVKFGQFIGSSPDIVGHGVAEEFRGFLDDGPPVPFDTVRETVERELSMPLASAFASFEREPCASASLAVVHRATLHDGQHAAVKVLRPDMERIVGADLALMSGPARFMAAQGSDSAMLLLEYLVGLKEQIAEELDLRNEARSMVYFSELFKRLRLERLAVPRVFDAYSSRRVLTMEYVDGAPIDDLASIEAFGLDPRPVVRQLMQAWILTAALHGVFHADIHAGNLHLQRDGRLAMLDWGIVARMDEETHLMLEWLLEASIGREEAWGKLARHLAQNRPTMSQTFGIDEAGLTRFVRASLEPILTQPIGEVTMSSLFGSTEDAIALATGEAPPKRTLRDRWRLLQTQRRGNRARLAAGEMETDSQRATFLAAKQLVYLERYWKMYLPEEPLLADREFVEAVLAERRSWLVAQAR